MPVLFFLFLSSFLTSKHLKDCELDFFCPFWLLVLQELIVWASQVFIIISQPKTDSKVADGWCSFPWLYSSSFLHVFMIEKWLKITDKKTIEKCKDKYKSPSPLDIDGLYIMDLLLSFSFYLSFWKEKRKGKDTSRKGK